jgi:radical SAM superfamily enzyme YgiQ (UPF0313 family)
MAKLLLITPSWTEPGLNFNRGFSFFPPLNLGIIAALTPPDWDVCVLDENFEPVDYDYPADLVGITFMTSLAPRAYAMADRFRAQGRMVVLGGVHVTALPEEASQHADAVVVGEAENLWPVLIADFLAGRMQPVYRAAERPSLEHWTRPRRELFAKEGYLMPTSTQTTRGCPFRCRFCSVTQFFGHTYRFRSVADVVAEVQDMASRMVFFVDDNIAGSSKRAKDLFRALIPLKVRWLSQASLTMAEDEEMLSLAEQSGCLGLFVGFESLDPSVLAAMGKPTNVVAHYETAIKRFRDHGIALEGAFVFGSDEDDESVFERTLKFAQRMRLEAAQFTALTPFPGTPLYQELLAAGRLIERDWAKYDMRQVVFAPVKMSPERLKQGVEMALNEFYSYHSIFRRLGIWRQNLRDVWGLNLAMRKAFLGA